MHAVQSAGFLAGDEDGAVRSRRKQAHCSQEHPPEPRRAARMAPQFTIASVSSVADIPVGTPAWRVMVGNLAAGATAGCAVEAGELNVAVFAPPQLPA